MPTHRYTLIPGFMSRPPTHTAASTTNAWPSKTRTSPEVGSQTAVTLEWGRHNTVPAQCTDFSIENGKAKRNACKSANSSIVVQLPCPDATLRVEVLELGQWPVQLWRPSCQGPFQQRRCVQNLSPWWVAMSSGANSFITPSLRLYSPAGLKWFPLGSEKRASCSS